MQKKQEQCALIQYNKSYHLSFEPGPIINKECCITQYDEGCLVPMESIAFGSSMFRGSTAVMRII